MARDGGNPPSKARKRGGVDKSPHHYPIGNAMRQPGLETNARGKADMADAMKQGSIGKSSGVHKSVASRSGH